MAGNSVISAILTLRDQNFSSGMSNAANNANGLTRRIKHTGNSINRFGKSAVSSFKSVATSVVGLAAAYVGVNAIKDLGVSMIEASASAKAMSSQFEQVFATLESSAETSLARVANQTGILSGRLKGTFLGMAAFAKTTGMDTAGALSLTERATLAAADGAAFYDKSIESVSESLQSFLKGNFANDAALGIAATETTRNAAANKLYGSSFKKLSEDQKQLTLLQMVEDGNKLSGALGQAARETDGLENVLGNLKESWRLVKVKFGDPLLAPVIKSMKKLTDGVLKINTDAVIAGFKKFGNIAKGAIDIIKPGLTWLKDNAVPGVKKAIDILGIGVLLLRDWAVDAFQNIKQRIDENKPAIEGVRSVMDDLGAKALQLKDWMLGAFESSKPALEWLKDVGLPMVVDGIAGVVEKATELYNDINNNWNLISPIVYGVAGAIVFFKTVVGLATLASKGLTLGMIAMSVAQTAFNAVLTISPLGWVAIAIGAVVAVGVLLYKNWDTVKLTALSLWETVKTVFSGIYEWGMSKIQPVVGFFQGLYSKFTDFKNAISSFALPEWVSKIGGVISSGASAVGNFVNGSHATGLNQVPYNGYIAELHKGEMIVPATQSRNLRQQGATIDNIDSLAPSKATTVNTSNSNSHSQNNNNVFNININGTNKSTSEILNELVPQLKLRMANI